MQTTYAPWTDEDWDIIMQLSLADRVRAERSRSIDVITMIRGDREDAIIAYMIQAGISSHVGRAFIGVDPEEVNDSFRGLDVHQHEMTHEDRQIRAIAYERDANNGRLGVASQMFYFDVLEEIGPKDLGGVNARCLNTRRSPVHVHHNYMAEFGMSFDDAYEITMRR